jgi:hypothetical protein
VIYLDDRLPRHPKILKAGDQLGENGVAQALALVVAGLAYAVEHLTDGYIPKGFVRSCGVCSDTTSVAKVLCSRDVRLWHLVRGGYRIHDFHDWNRKASEVKDLRAKERERKRRQRLALVAPSKRLSRGLSGRSPTVTRARARYHDMYPRHVPTYQESTQLEEVTFRVPVPTSKNLPPPKARRATHEKSKCVETDRATATLRDCQNPDRRGDHGRRMENADQRPSRPLRLCHAVTRHAGECALACGTRARTRRATATTPAARDGGTVARSAPLDARRSASGVRARDGEIETHGRAQADAPRSADHQASPRAVAGSADCRTGDHRASAALRGGGIGRAA